MAQTEFTKIWEQGAEAERKKILGQLLIAQNNSQGELFPEETPDLPVTPDTRLGDFQEQGGWMDKDKPWRDLNPRRKGYVPPRTRRSEENKKRKAQDAQKQSILEKWRRDNGLDPNGNAFPPGWNLQIKGDMPPDVNTPWLPGGQSTEGIPNVDNPKLKEVLKKRKGIKQQNPGLDIPDFLKNINPIDLLKIIPAAGGALLQQQLQIGQSGPAPTWPPHKWPYPTPGQGPLPNPDIPEKIAELNPAQIKALEELKGVDKLPPTERLQRMREITEKVKGLA